MTDFNGTVAAIVVTHNRLEHLRRCLGLIADQTRPLDEVLVFDNVSTDGTAEFLAGQNGAVSVITSKENVGGAGGFHLGIKEAWERGHEWFWLMDDDSAPTPDALEQLMQPLAHLDARPAILSSRVLWSGDDRLHPMNMPVARRHPHAFPAAFVAGLMPLRATSFVSCLLHRSAVDGYGLPHLEYFVWNDDLEYTARVLRHEPGFWVPASVVYHETPNPHEVGAARPEKFYFEVRNKLYMLRGPAWSMFDRMRWARSLTGQVAAFLRQHRYRRTAVNAVARGVFDGLRRMKR